MMNKTLATLMASALLAACSTASHQQKPSGLLIRESGSADCPSCAQIVRYRAMQGMGRQQQSREPHFKGLLDTNVRLQAGNSPRDETFSYQLELDIRASGNFLAVMPLVAVGLPAEVVQQQDAGQLHVWLLDRGGQRTLLPLLEWSKKLPLQDFLCQSSPGDGQCSWKQVVTLPASVVRQALQQHSALRLMVGSAHSSTVYGMHTQGKSAASVLTQYKGVNVELPPAYLASFDQALQQQSVVISP
ncbi:hypothetical protein [Aquitalea denitrificans]|uniref:hypothetical protein n=1 Tax=Aquitalea denitrificans TaxID=519081 RepID=UPI00135A405A|nr:hypothetical protein [Aquitalea denitrificans]